MGLPFVANADANSEPSDAKIAKLISSHNQKPNRHRVPGNVYLECWYSSEYIRVQFPFQVMSMELTIEDGDDVIWEGQITKDNPCIEIPQFSGCMTLTCVTDQNQMFIGTLCF